MIAYRTFRNSDPPHLARIWNDQSPQSWLYQPMSVTRLEQFVLGRPYFRPDHLWLATREDQPIGFAHAAFGPTLDGTSLDLANGVVSALFVAKDEPYMEIAPALLERVERSLREAGATRMVSGGLAPIDPFYWGLHGGALSCGVPVSDKATQDLYRGAGYHEQRQYVIWERPLFGFRCPVDRYQLQIKRTCAAESVNDLPAANWWEAVMFGQIDRARYSLRSSGVTNIDAEITYWDMQPLDDRRAKRAVGLLDGKINPIHFQDGMATFLLADSLRQLLQLGITHAAAVTARADNDWNRLLGLLCFQEIDQSIVWEKT